MKTMPDVVNLAASLNGSGKTLRIELERGFRAPVRNGNPTIEAMWRADLWELPPVVLGRRKPRFLGTFVTDSAKEQTPADLLRQLADIYEAGELRVKP